MNYDLVSTLRGFAYGVVVEDKIFGSNLLKVKVLDHLPSLVGEVNTALEIQSAKVRTPKGIVEKTIIVGDYIEAKFLNRDANRATAPDVTKGMRVYLWRDADSEKYYWEYLDTDEVLKKTEHVIFAFSNKPETDNNALNFDNAWIIEVDTRHGRFGVSTNKNNGEAFAYDIHVDAKKGSAFIKDDVGNHFQIESNLNAVELKNGDGSYYRVTGMDIEEYCPGNKVTIIDGDHSVIVKGIDYTKAASHNFESDKITMKTPKLGVDGMLDLSQIITMAAFSAGSPPTVPPPEMGKTNHGELDDPIVEREPFKLENIKINKQTYTSRMVGNLEVTMNIATDSLNSNTATTNSLTSTTSDIGTATAKTVDADTSMSAPLGSFNNIPH